jgi:MYXO-CTERM domain-containing protein
MLVFALTAVIVFSWRAHTVHAATTTSKITASGFACDGKPCDTLTLSVGDRVVYVNDAGFPVTLLIAGVTPSEVLLAPLETWTYVASTPTSGAVATARSIAPPLAKTQALVVNPLSTATTTTTSPTAQLNSSTTTPTAPPTVSTSSTQPTPGAARGGDGSAGAGGGDGAPGTASQSTTSAFGGVIVPAGPGGNDLGCISSCSPAGGSALGLPGWFWLALGLAAAALVAIVATQMRRYRRSGDPTASAESDPGHTPASLAEPEGSMVHAPPPVTARVDPA